jgi:hypothetical protein
MSDLSPFSGAKQKSDFGAVRAAFDPTETSRTPASLCHGPRLQPIALDARSGRLKRPLAKSFVLTNAAAVSVSVAMPQLKPPQAFPRR